ncbi:occlusion-derived virus envelope protein [Anticarsia gemmatalis multiple nucleopolyhedrovirus]|uniref:Occlusion-derived virus envelope protein n=1 Tax=Anticarsia gemmatalis multiple nucleopolyhedrovirus TaxID=268591 RepID=A0A0S3J2T0_9ABAC|nr:occlusion-derived virus envelope protein [Anticarsia gemmatalis multiple nucleopolyhedrovirus]ALR69953.1 occlusion-derived virus envelope protein [Anticarsia gemmatalis multiple nucleopolyhedrovirus]ALR70111.1 occlusion-derived virus envelope protein [Anticarsia gemmatalis multiple nucleopolyhedrovirus]ALR70738.1 occlusion-derived virus envelope protein [Anticarsia gemmatalis multiple nucleopolyhedrovirus]ALR70895.1 occlusion-derived virus envelope protein [Anticarsia gemmatalis multiple nuc
METPKMLPGPIASPKRAAALGAIQSSTFVKTVVTTTTVSTTSEKNLVNQEHQDRIAQVIAQLQKTRLDFTKLTQLQKRRVKNMQRLVRKKNNIIANLAAQLDRQQAERARGSKYFAVMLSKNVLLTMSGSEQFVRQRVADVSAAGGEQVFCARRKNCIRDRERISKALETSLGSGVVARAANKRFEIVEADKIVSAKLIAQQVLHDGFDGDACTY